VSTPLHRRPVPGATVPGNAAITELPHLRLPQHSPVLVVGGGPVGLALALELSLRGVGVFLIERETEIAHDHVRARSFNRRLVEHLHRWGVWEELTKRWTVPPEWVGPPVVRTSLVGHDLVASTTSSSELDSDETIFSMAQRLGRPQYVLRSVLAEEAVRQGAVIAGGYEAVGVDENTSGGAVVRIRDLATGVEYQVAADFVVAADGSTSSVRRSAGITRSGINSTEKFYNVAVKVPHVFETLGTPPRANNIIYNKGFTNLFSLFDDVRWGFPVGPFPVGSKHSAEDFVAYAKNAIGSDIPVEFESAGPYLVGTRIADRFQIGRVFVAGDAAHVRPPGGNLAEGIGDVANFGWKIAAVLNGYAGPDLLDSYDQERRPHALRVAQHAYNASRYRTEIADYIKGMAIPDDCDHGEAAQQARANITRFLEQKKGWHNAIGVEFDERYDASSINLYRDSQHDHERAWDPFVYEDILLPGHRFPGAVGKQSVELIYGKTNSHFTLVSPEILPASVKSQWQQEAKSIGVVLDIIVEPALHDALASSEALEAVLVRPDQKISCRCDPKKVRPREILHHALGYNIKYSASVFHNTLQDGS
jgi:2-polyprenyl-6-methoxyphenol hydroxylase-like FAD-dependent oxidoreductase